MANDAIAQPHMSVIPREQHTISRKDISENALKVLYRLNKAGYEAYLVGGGVRDLLLGKKPKDFDVTTSATPEQVRKLFRNCRLVGRRFRLAHVMFGPEIIEVATFRGHHEAGASDRTTSQRGQNGMLLRDNIFGSIEEDAQRRDFTINSLYYSVADFTVRDYVGGMQDLKEGLIRLIGTPETRYREDPVRMLRAVRFAAQLGFSIEEKTRQAVADLADNLQKVSAERIQTEMVKLLTSAHPEEMRTVYELGLSRVFLPEFDRMMETPQITKHHCYSVGEHTIHAMQEVQQDRILRLTMLLHDVAKPVCVTTDEKGQNHFKGHPAEGAEMARVILRRLKFDNETIKRVCLLVRYHDDRPAVTPRNVRRAISRIGVENMEALFAVKRADTLAQSMYERQKKLSYIDAYEETYREILKEHQCVQKKDLAINGRDLIAQGMKTGKEMGEVLQALYEQVLDEPQLNNKETLLALALQLQQTKQE